MDCTGLSVSPGFIDAHSHSDLQVLEGRTEKLQQGVTAEVVGNCGFSPYPALQFRSTAGIRQRHFPLAAMPGLDFSKRISCRRSKPGGNRASAAYPLAMAVCALPREGNRLVR